MRGEGSGLGGTISLNSRCVAGAQQLEGTESVEGSEERIVAILPECLQHVTTDSSQSSLILNGAEGSLSLAPHLKSDLESEEQLVIQHGQSWPLDFIHRLGVKYFLRTEMENNGSKINF